MSFSRLLAATDLPAWLLNTFANVVMYGAPANTKRTQAYVTATSGSPSVTFSSFSGSTFSSSDVGKNIVISGLGPDVAQSASVAAGGTGHAVGDVLTLIAAGASISPKLRVEAVASGVILLAVPVIPGSCSPVSLPTNPLSVASTTGSGTGATFNITWAAIPLQTTIAAVGGASSITLGANSQQTVTGATEWVAWGNDDAPAINSALSSGANSIIFPNSITYGIFSTINLPHESRVKLSGNGCTIVALSPMATMLDVPKPSSFFYSEGSVIEGIRLDGMGVAQKNISHNAFKWTYRDNIFLNATVGNVYIGDAGGSGENTLFIGNQYRNDPVVTGAPPLYNVSVDYSDNHFTDEIGADAINNFIDNGAGNYWTNIHGYNSKSSQFVLNGNFKATNLYADSIPSYVAGIQVNGTYGLLNGWFGYAVGGTGQSGVFIAQKNGYNLVTNGCVQGVTPLNAIARGWTLYQGSTNIVSNNVGATYQNTGGASTTTPGGGDGSVALGYSAFCNGGSAISLGAFTQSGFGGIAIGNNNNAFNSGTAIGIGASDNGAMRLAWSPNLNTTVGRNQIEFGVLSGSLSAGSAARLTADGGAAAATNSLTLPANSVAAYGRVTVAAYDYANTRAAMFYVDGILAVRGATASTARLVGTPTVTLAQSDAALTSAGLSSSSLAVAADTTNGALSFTLTAPTGIAMRVTQISHNAAVQ